MMPAHEKMTLGTSSANAPANAVKAWETLRTNGLDEPKSYLCPSTTTADFKHAETGKLMTGYNTSYGYFVNPGVGVISTSTCGGSSVIAADAKTGAATKAQWNHDKKGAYLRIDSSVTRPGGAMWINEIKTSNAITDDLAADSQTLHLIGTETVE
jgi:hypothetical protein